MSLQKRIADLQKRIADLQKRIADSASVSVACELQLNSTAMLAAAGDALQHIAI